MCHISSHYKLATYESSSWAEKNKPNITEIGLLLPKVSLQFEHWSTITQGITVWTLVYYYPRYYSLNIGLLLPKVLQFEHWSTITQGITVWTFRALVPGEEMCVTLGLWLTNIYHSTYAQQIFGNLAAFSNLGGI